jgi:hypothetical protein
MGVRVIASQAQASGRLTLADASGVIYGDEGMMVRSSEVAAVEMDTAPTGASAAVSAVQVVSMFQTNSRCLLAERRISVRVADTKAVATLTGIQWGIGGDSPADD